MFLASGLTVTEALACNTPLVIFDAIPGQEEENAEFLENAGVAVWLRKDSDFDSIIAELLSDKSKLHKMKLNTKLLAKKHSTQDICNIVLGDETLY